MSIITESKITRRLAVLLVMIMGVAMIIPSNLAFASPDDGSDEGSESGGGSSDEGTTEEDDQTETEEQLTEEPIEELPPIDEVPIDPCEANPNAPGCETDPVDPCLEDPNAVGCGTDPVDPCLTNPSASQCQDPCEVNPDLPECQDPCEVNPDLPECQGYCDLYPGHPGCYCGPGTHFENGKCVPNENSGGGSSSSSSSASATVNLIGAEVSSCRLDGNAHGIQQKFNPVRYQACGLYPNAQLAYTDGFVAGCTQVGNTQQLCQAFVVMNTQQTQTAATQPITQSTTQPTQAIQPATVS